MKISRWAWCSLETMKSKEQYSSLWFHATILWKNTIHTLFRQSFVKMIIIIIRWRPNSQMWILWIQTGFWIPNHASIVRLFEIEQFCGWKKHRLGYIGCIHLWGKLQLQWKWIKSLQIRIHLETRSLIWLNMLYISPIIVWNHTMCFHIYFYILVISIHI